MNRRTALLLAGPLLFTLIAILPTQAGLPYPAQLTIGITLWMALWWIAEIVDTAVTGLLPLVLFPLCGILPLKVVSAEYGNEILFLFLGGFFFGKTIERWQLHRRIALRLVNWLGTNPERTVLGFMVATGFISMWISNTATAVMMTPVAIAVAQSAGGDAADKGHANFCKALLLGVGYACSIGGLGTIVGTPTNAIFISFVQQKMGTTVSFWQWFLFGFPFCATLLVACWFLLIRLFPLSKTLINSENAQAMIQSELAAMGKMKLPEKRLLWLFGTVILAWVSGSLVWYRWWPNCNDTVVMMAGAILLFLIPAGVAADKMDAMTEGPGKAAAMTEGPGKPAALLDWATALRIPWGIMLLFGGGLALAKGFDQSGLANWMGEAMRGLSALPHVLIILVVLSVVVLLSEVASNIATASMMMPVLAALAVSIGTHPFALLLSATMAASFGFGLPVATAPNSIVYSAGYLRTRDMARAGFLLDGVAVLLLLAFLYGLLPWVWGIRV